jgi:hypothetical protein
VQARYGYTITEQVEQVPDVPNNRSNGSAILNVAFPGGFSTRGLAFWQRTHGGLRFPCEVMDPPTEPDPHEPPFPPCPNEGPIDDVRMTEFHRMLRDNYLHLGWGLSYALGSWALSGEYLWTARGSNSHDIRVLSITAGRGFELRRR